MATKPKLGDVARDDWSAFLGSMSEAAWQEVIGFGKLFAGIIREAREARDA